jgi:hypothetical protein
MTDCKSSYSSLMLILKMDKYNETGQGIFTRILESPVLKDVVNDVRFKGGSVCPVSLEAFTKTFGVPELSLSKMVSGTAKSTLSGCHVV